ncbi:MAG: tetratricopeptide repeat protein [Gemmatimonadota bacterium]
MKSISKLKDQARAHEQKENWQAAIQAYQKVLSALDDAETELDLGLYNRIGDLYYRVGQPDRAVHYYAQAAQKYAEIGLFNNAIALCNKALRYRPDDPRLFRMLGEYSAEQGFLVEARRWYLKFAERQVKAGKVEEAFVALEEFAALADDPSVRETLADQFLAHGRAEEARKQLEHAYKERLERGESVKATALAERIREMDPSANLEALAEEAAAAAEEADAGDDLVIETSAGAAGFRSGNGETEERAEVEGPSGLETRPDEPVPEPEKGDTVTGLETGYGERTATPTPQPGSGLAGMETFDTPPGSGTVAPDAGEASSSDTGEPAPSDVLEEPPEVEAEGETVAEGSEEDASLPDHWVIDTGEEASAEAEEEREDAAWAEEEPPPAEVEEAPAEAQEELPVGPQAEEPVVEADEAPAAEAEDAPAAEGPEEFAGEPPVEQPVVEAEEAPAAEAEEAPAAEAPEEFAAEPPAEQPVVEAEQPAIEAEEAPTAEVEEAWAAEAPAEFPGEAPVEQPVVEAEEAPAAEAPAEFPGEPPVEQPVVEAEQPVIEAEEFPAAEAPAEVPGEPQEEPAADVEGELPAEASEEEFAAEPPYDMELPDIEWPQQASGEEPPLPPLDLGGVDIASESAGEMPELQEAGDESQPESSEGSAPESESAPLLDLGGGVLLPDLGLEPGEPAEEEAVAAFDPSAFDLTLAGATESPADGRATMDVDKEAVLQRSRELVSRGLHEEALSELHLLLVPRLEARVYHDALAVINEMLRQEPDDFAALQRRVEFAAYLADKRLLAAMYSDLAAFMMLKGAEAKATAVYRRVLELDPGNEAARRVLGAGGEADAFVDLAAFLDEDGLAAARASGEASAQVEDFAELFSQFKAKVTEDVAVEESGSHYDLGLAFKEMGLIDEAIAEFQTALRGGEERLKVYEELGKCFMLKEQYTVAVKILSRALDLPREDPHEMLGVYYNLGLCHEELGDRSAARQAYDNIIVIDPSFSDVPERLSRL